MCYVWSLDRTVASRDQDHISLNARDKSSFCSQRWLLAEPVAGLADAGRETPMNGCVPHIKKPNLDPHVTPGSHILRLFLNPPDGRLGRIVLERGRQFGLGQRIELFESQDGHVVALPLRPLGL